MFQNLELTSELRFTFD